MIALVIYRKDGEITSVQKLDDAKSFEEYVEMAKKIQRERTRQRNRIHWEV